MKNKIKTILFTLILLAAGFSYSCGQVKCGKTNNSEIAETGKIPESPGDAGFSNGTMTEIEAPDLGNGAAAETIRQEAAPEKQTEEKGETFSSGKNTKGTGAQKQTKAAAGKKAEKVLQESVPVSAVQESAGTEETGTAAASASNAEKKAARTDRKPSSAETEKSSLVNINTASKDELMKLKGVGEVKALRILEYRKSHGGFKNIEEIMKVRGIKEGSFQKIRDSITV
jgi:competence protein ComEA